MQCISLMIKRIIRQLMLARVCVHDSEQRKVLQRWFTWIAFRLKWPRSAKRASAPEVPKRQVGQDDDNQEKQGRNLLLWKMTSSPL